jgi:hypothetical protein
MIATTAGIMAISANAATIDYLGSSESGDIANAGYWSGNAVPTANDTARFPDAFLSPVAGLSLGGSLVFGNLAWDDTSSRELDLGGKTLTLDDSSGTSQLSLGANATLTIKNGAFNVESVTNRFLPSGDYCTLVLTNATMTLNRPNWRLNGSYGKGFSVKVLKDAKLVATGLPTGDQMFPMIGNYSTSFLVDGGFVSMMSQRAWSGETYRRVAFNQSWEDGCLTVRNGGVLDFTGPYASVMFGGAKAKYTFDNAELYQTNGVRTVGTEYGIYYYNDGGTDKIGYFSMTNSIFKGIGFGIGGRNAKLTFHDSDVDLYFNGNSNAGLFFYGTGQGNAMTISGDTSFKAKIVKWTSSICLGMELTVTGGSFDSHVEMSGTNAVFRISGGNVKSVIAMNGSHNAVEMTGGSLEHNSDLAIAGVSNLVSFAGDASVTGTYFVVSGEGAELSISAEAMVTNIYTALSGDGAKLTQDGGTAYGGIRFESGNTRVCLKNGAYRYGKHKTEGLQFKNGIANAVLVIDNATLHNDGNFSAHYSGTGHPYTDAGCVYTNCPGSAIEFRGENPRLINTKSEVFSGGAVYMAMVLGSFAQGDSQTGSALGTDPLPDPLALRYILPPAGYVEAPLYGNAFSGVNARPIALCGNARIEVDASAFVHPENKKHVLVPLIKDEANFSCHGYRMLDIEALNRNNAAYLPDNARLEYVEAEKTIYLKLTNPHIFSIILR